MVDAHYHLVFARLTNLWTLTVQRSTTTSGHNVWRVLVLGTGVSNVNVWARRVDDPSVKDFMAYLFWLRTICTATKRVCVQRHSDRCSSSPQLSRNTQNPGQHTFRLFFIAMCSNTVKTSVLRTQDLDSSAGEGY